MNLNRSTLYYKPKPESEENLTIMEIIDKYTLEHPTTGVVHMTAVLNAQGLCVNPKRTRRLMRKMNIIPIYPKKSISVGGKDKYIYPYLLRGIDATAPNQIWSTDISYIPIRGGFMYLYAVIDVFSRYIVGWRLSNTLSSYNCQELLKDCISIYGTPQIVNSDQGSQYTTAAWVELLSSNNIQISMDSKGRCKDNIWIERFWRTIKQEYIYINPVDTIKELREGITKFIKFYNFERPHQGIGSIIPAMMYGIVA